MNSLIPWPSKRAAVLGLQLPEDLPAAEWRALYAEFEAVSASLNWLMGDWLNFGCRKYGEKYALALALTGWNYDHLVKAKYVAARVPFRLRNRNLHWSHHEAVAPLTEEEQEKWLARAEAEKLKVGDLRKEIALSYATRLPSNARALGWVPAVWAAEGVRELRKLDFSDWEEDRKEALRIQLRPLVEIYQKLS